MSSSKYNSSLVIGHWSLVIGRWLVIGHWSLIGEASRHETEAWTANAKPLVRERALSLKYVSVCRSPSLLSLRKRFGQKEPFFCTNGSERSIPVIIW